MTAKLSQRRRTVRLHCPHFERLFEFEGAEHAHLCPRKYRGRPRTPARGTVPRPWRHPPRGAAGPRGRVRAVPGLGRSPDPGRARVARNQRAVHAPGGGDRRRPRRAGRGRRHADGVRQVAVLHGARPAGDHRGRRVPGALPVPDQGPRPGPGRRTDGADEGGRARGCRGDVRRRHAGADPVGHPDRGPGRRHEPGHAQLGDPAPPHQVVPAVRAAEGHRRRRAPHVPGGVRQPRRQRPAAAAADLRPLRQPAR